MDYFLLLGLAITAGTFSLWCPCGYSIAETVTHTVSGWRRFRVRSILLISTTFSAATFGFVIGLIAMIFKPGHLSVIVIVAAAALALIADEIGRHWRPLKPLAVGRQVPRQWGIIFSPEIVSVLYGLRLGIAPLTILASWVWWVAIIASAFYGPWFSALVGATFGISRIIISELSTAGTNTNSMARRMSKVRAIERPLRLVGVLAFIIATVLIANYVTITDQKSRADVTLHSMTSVSGNTSTTVPQKEPYASLAEVLPTELPGYRIDNNAKATGSLDLNAAVAAESDHQAERALLETRHFQNGYGRAFTNDKSEVYMVVYNFADADGSSLYLEDGFITLYGNGAGTYDVTDVPGARGFSEGTEFNGQPAIVHGVAFAKADRFVLVFTRSESTSTPTQARQLASTLYARA